MKATTAFANCREKVSNFTYSASLHRKKKHTKQKEKTIVTKE